MYCGTRTPWTYTSIRRPTRKHREKVYVYNNSHIHCVNDEKNQRFYNNQFGVSYISFVELIIIHLTIINEDIC